MTDERVEIFFENRVALRTWLLNNHGRSTGIWAQFYKKSTAISDLSWEAVVEECLCFGWIDSLPGKVDDLRTKVYISPRKPTSGWSRRNKQVLDDLMRQRVMHSSGIEAVERAKANGSWTRFDLAENMIIPPQLSEVLNQDLLFAGQWKKLSDSQKRQFLQQFYEAKTDATRNKRIKELQMRFPLK